MKKISKLLKNFYFVFCVCVLAVLAVSFSYVFKNIKEYNLRQMALKSPQTYIEYEEKTVSAVNENVKKEEFNKATEIVPEENNEVNVMSIIQEEEFKIEKPVKNDVINKFSQDELVYSKTYEDYRTHNGTDIKSERGKAVFAVYDGVVENVYTDALEGIVIIINHGNGYQSVYKNLSGDEMVRKGDSVTRGQAISGVGETGIFEAAEESHLHFELIKDGKYVDPEIYFE